MLGIVSDEEFDKSLIDVEVINQSIIKNDHDNLGEVKQIPRGRGLDNNAVPNSIRKLIGEESILGTPAKELSEAFGVSKSSVSAYIKSATSTASYHKPNQDLLDHNNQARERITKKSRRLLLKAIDNITDEKLSGTKALELASIAKNMSGIMKDMTPDGPISQTNNNVLIYAPRIKEEDEFEVIEVRN